VSTEVRVLVLDVGTSSVKAVLFDRDGRVAAEHEAAYPTHSMPGGREEQRPDDWWSAAVAATSCLDKKNIECISLTGTMQSVIPLDAAGRPVRPAMLYSDSRASALFQHLAPRFERLGAGSLLGNQPNEFMSVFKMAWLRQHEPDSFRRARVFHSGAKDFVLYQLTGEHVTDPTAATTVGLMDLRARDWSRELADAAEIPIAALPRIEAADAQVGVTSQAAARALGVRSGVPVVNGCGDAGAATVGAGVTRSDSAYAYLGTSAWVAVVRRVAALTVPHELYTLAHPTDGLAIRIAAMLCGGDSAAWFAGVAGTSFEMLERQLAEVDSAAPDLLFLPYLKGERSPFIDPRVRGAFIGLERGHRAAELYYAVLEGVALALAANMDALGIADGDIRLIGGGGASAMWGQLIADVSGRRVLVAQVPTAVTAYGAFRVAAARSGCRERAEEWSRQCVPRNERAARAATRRRAFDDLTQQVRLWTQRL